jgi:hypothetical protein
MIPDYMHMYIAILNSIRTQSQNLSFMHAYVFVEKECSRLGILQSVAIATSSHLPRLTFCSISSGT